MSGTGKGEEGIVDEWVQSWSFARWKKSWSLAAQNLRVFDMAELET